MGATKTTLYFLPDTNLFIQCRPLKDLDWAVWKGYDAIDLLVTPPVQREIDYQKSNGRGRVQKRAREASSLFRQVIQSQDKVLVIRDASPRVTLRLRLDCAPNAELDNQLDYEERDDQLVGTLSGFLKNNPDLTAELLTDDTGPMAKADMVHVPWKPIPTDWLLESEGTNEEKRIRTLETEITRLKNAEPLFDVVAVDVEGRPVDRFQYEVVRCEPLNDAEIESLLTTLRDTFPVETDFGSSERSERDAPVLFGIRISGLKETYEPADPEDIDNYRDKLYPAWLEACEKRLRSMHDLLNDEVGQPTFAFVATNDGTRPANDALVTITAHGGFVVMPTVDDYEADDGDNKNGADARRGGHMPTLPAPPAPPKGAWQQSFSFERHFRDITRGLAGFGDLHGASRRLLIDQSLPSLRPLAGLRRDPNAFYYKSSRTSVANHSFALECEQWRHGGDTERFSGKILFPGDETTIRGALELAIQAENLSDPVSKRVPVVIAVTKRSTLEYARRLVADLCKG